MIDLFEKPTLDLSNIICHSGGAIGSDSEWESSGLVYGVKTRAYSYKTSFHDSTNKIEISETDFKEGIEEINKANRILNRYGIHKYINLLARNWAQVKYSSQIFAIGNIVKPGLKGIKNYYNRSKIEVVDGGTGYAVMMGINHKMDIFVFNQLDNNWYRWSYASMSFIRMESIPKITEQNFAGIGTREITDNGKKAIREVYRLTFKDRKCFLD